MTLLHNICPTGICTRINFNNIYILNYEIKHMTEGQITYGP